MTQMEGNTTNAVSAAATTSVPPVTNPPVVGASNDDVKTRLDSLEREKKGIYEDLKATREKAQALKEEIDRLKQEREAAAQANAAPAIPISSDDPVEQMLAQRYIQYSKPLIEEVQQLKQQIELKDTYSWLAKQEKRDVDEVVTDKELERRIVDTAKRYGLAGSTFTVAKRAYELLKRDEREATAAAQQAEADRVRAISANATETGNVPPSGTAREFSREEINKMSNEEYDRNRAEILKEHRERLIK
jgi:hypothetical protein